jgi:glutamate synthase domain-containing protein 2
MKNNSVLGVFQCPAYLVQSNQTPMRKIFVISCIVVTVLIAVWAYYWIEALFAFILVAPLIYMGFVDMAQDRQAIRRNFPLLGRLRYVFEDMRPKIQQYFVESDTDGTPLNRNERSVIYQRAKKQVDTIPFGTQLNVYAEGYEWMTHSINPQDHNKLDHSPRVRVGNKDCKQPYEASVLNVSAMSFGSLSPNAIESW